MNNVTADPRFVGASDYHLQSNSPAKDTATSTYTQPVDYEGTLRPQRSGPDIGAYERGTTVPGIRSHATATASNTQSSVTIARPWGSLAGDFLLATIVHDGGQAANITAPAGWIAAPQTDYWNTNSERTRVLYKFAGAFEPGAYTFTVASSWPQDVLGGITAFTGVDRAMPINASLGQVNPSSSQVTAPSISPTWRNTRLVFVGGSITPATWTPPFGMAERFELRSSGTYPASMEMATQPYHRTGPTGQRIATMSSAYSNVAVLLALNPA